MGGDGSFPDEVKSMRNDVPLLPHSPPFHRRSKWGLSSQKTQNNHRAKGNHKVRERKKKKKKHRSGGRESFTLVYFRRKINFDSAGFGGG